MANPSDPPDPIRQDLLQRLRWPIFSPLHSILVQENPTLIPFSSYPGTSQPLANPPLSKLAVRIGGLEWKHTLDETEGEDRYKPPAPLVIENKSGEGITLGEFVVQVHEYLNANKGEIMDWENVFWADDEGGFADAFDPQKSDGFPMEDAYYFDEARKNEVDVDELEVAAEVFVAGRLGLSLERFWETRDIV